VSPATEPGAGPLGPRTPRFTRWREPDVAGSVQVRQVHLPCILCSMDEWVGWMHQRENWNLVVNREAMALAHGLVLAPGGSIRTGPWVPWRDLARDDGEYEET
jgi:hypothetical protein